MRNGILWTIDELAAQVTLALAEGYEGQASGRVRDVPDRRAIRYYTTLGLLDRPAEMRGRTAFYGRRHLLQIVAIKRLQSRGLSLVQIQQELLGQTDAALARIARLPPDRETPSPSRSADFWKQAPAAPAPVPEPVPAAAAVLQGIPLAEDVTLLFKASRLPVPEDIDALRVAAGPLLQLLRQLHLLPVERTNP